jgi:FG-GAP repeat
MGTQVVQRLYFRIHGDMPASFKYNTRGTLGLVIRLFFLFLFVFAIADRNTAIAGFVLEQKLTAVGGNAVAIAGEQIVVGAPTEDGAKGAVRVYKYDSSTMTWIEKTLVASDGAAGDQFGFCVAIADDRIVVGAPFDNEGSGSAYVFRFDLGTMSWSQEQKITASDAAPNDFFGFSIAIAGDHIVIGSPLDDDKASRSGAVYVYRLDSGTAIWVQEQKLVTSDGTEEDSLGWSVAIGGERIVAGATQTNNCGCNPNRPGSVYVFGFDSGSGNWGFEAKLIPPDGIEGDLFGNSVSISGDRMIVGTLFGGYAYVFRRNNETLQWATEQKLEPMGGTSLIEFGSAVAIAGDRIAVGAPRSNTDRGAVYVFGFDPETTQWVQAQILTGSDASLRPRFGQSVATASERIVAGEPGSGAANIFRFNPDSDGDGMPDEQDQCPQSDTRPTVIIDGLDSGVANALLTEPAGCTITDEILNLAAEAHSHGQFVSQVDRFLLELQKAGILEPNEKQAIKDAAAQSTLP